MTVHDHPKPLLRAIDIVGDRWTMLILEAIFDRGALRFLELQERLGVSPNTLSSRLKRMEAAGLLTRRRYLDAPPRWEYDLTPAGAGLRPIFDMLYKWGARHGD